MTMRREGLNNDLIMETVFKSFVKAVKYIVPSVISLHIFTEFLTPDTIINKISYNIPRENIFNKLS